MTKERITRYLEPAPPAVRQLVLDDILNVEPGAAAVLGRFFRAMKEHGGPPDAPGPEPFIESAKSESTLSTLLRALDRYAPRVSTAAGRELRKSWYRKRGRAGAIDSGALAAQVPSGGPKNWPSSWRQMWPALRSSPIRDSSKHRYFASICRCADMLPGLDLPLGVTADSPGYFVGITLGDAFVATGARPRTASGYLDGLVALMRAGGMDKQTLNGLRAARDHFKALGRASGKFKTSRIRHLLERGGFEYIIQTICRLRDEIDDLPDHAARTEKLRVTVAVLMLLVNKPARAGDVTEWRFGHELCRHQNGEWALDWRQGKTNIDTGAGYLWPETCAALDELVLRGRPLRLVEVEYHKLIGSNFLTGTVGVHSVRWTSELVRDAIGIPAHDLRTLAADYLRLHDPATAVSVIQSHLGHGTRKAGDEYRALAEGDAAAAAWRLIREEIAQKSADGASAQI